MAITTDRTTRDDTRVEERVDGSRPVETRTEETRTTTDPYAGIAVARDRFGGIDIPASIVGMLTALSTTIISPASLGPPSERLTTRPASKEMRRTSRPGAWSAESPCSSSPT
jgi:hypothetical protein